MKTTSIATCVLIVFTLFARAQVVLIQAIDGEPLVTQRDPKLERSEVFRQLEARDESEWELHHHLYLADLAKGVILADCAIGPRAQVYFSSKENAIWVSENPRPTGTRVRKLALPGLNTVWETDFVYPILQYVPSDPLAQLRPQSSLVGFGDNLLAALVYKQVPVPGSVPTKFRTEDWLVIFDTAKKEVREFLQIQVQGVGSFFPLGNGRAVLLFNFGEGLLLTSDGQNVSTNNFDGFGFTRAYPKVGNLEGAAVITRPEGHLCLGVSFQGELLHSFTGQVATISLNIDRKLGFSKGLISGDPNAKVASVSFQQPRRDLEFPSETLMLVDLQANQIKNSLQLLPLDALLQIDENQTIFAAGPKIYKMTNGAIQELFQIKGRRVLRLVPVSP
jgi:hypothetical protein